MKSIFWLLVLFTLAVALALGLRLNQGVVLLVLPPWRVELSLNLFLCLSLLFLVGGYAILRSLFFLSGLSSRVSDFRSRRQKDKASIIFQEAVRLLFEGRFGQALKKAATAHEMGLAPGLTALIAARAAQRLRDTPKQEEWMEKALNEDPRTEAATLMLAAEMQLDARQFAKALALLQNLQDKQGRHLAALRLELRARQGLKDWEAVLKLVRVLEKRDALLPEVAKEIRKQAHLENIAQLASDAQKLTDYLKKLPAADRDHRLMCRAVESLLSLGAEKEARHWVETALDDGNNEDWNAGLALLYGLTRGDEGMAQIAKAEKWLKKQPKDSNLLLSLGRLCRHQRLWGKAQNYLEAAIAVSENKAARLELASLFDQLGQTEEANRHYRACATI